jgi:hypothetical protein
MYSCTYFDCLLSPVSCSYSGQTQLIKAGECSIARAVIQMLTKDATAIYGGK